jgi:hypothetical protein
MQHFYDGQIRRYITQMIRMLSNFPVKDGNGNLKQVPVMYGDLTRQVAQIIRDNSENKLPSAPRISLYVTGLEMDRDRLQDPSFVRKQNVIERSYDEDGQQYLNTQGKNYTVEKMMPTPYKLTVNADIWSSNTDQKLQLLEQILIYFDPSLEIQTTDNYIDWASLTIVNLENVNWSNRSVPVGVDSEIDVATLTFSTPIYISPPVKVKRMGAITNIITSIFDERTGDIDLGLSQPELNRYDDFAESGRTTDRHKAGTTISDIQANVNDGMLGVYIEGDTGQLYGKGAVNWRSAIDKAPGTYQAGVSRIFLTDLDNDSTITGTFTVNELNETLIVIDWDTDSFPDDDVITGPSGDRTSIDAIIDPTKSNPANIKTAGARILLLENVSSDEATEFPEAWQNNDGSGLVANANDIVEWDGTKWVVIFDSQNITATTYITNLNTGKQYKYANGEWLLSVEGEYPVGTWRIDLYG